MIGLVLLAVSALCLFVAALLGFDVISGGNYFGWLAAGLLAWAVAELVGGWGRRVP